MRFTLLYPSFAKKAVTFSYDDGVLQDRQTIGILNSYHLKGTFNVNYGHSGLSKIRNGIDCSHLVLQDSIAVYEGHEIASHTYSHPHLEGLPYEDQRKEFGDDVAALSALFGKPVVGAAYPFGTYDLTTLRVLKDLHVEYARTTLSTYAFRRPYDFLLWHPTIHHRDPELMPMLRKFCETEEELAIFFLWGHSYEFALDGNFSVLEDFCAEVSAHQEIWSATNHEIFDYVTSANMVYYRDGFFVNPSPRDVFLMSGGNRLVVPAFSHLPYVEGKA
jgi:peptidoglycan-N-acetylglucosamine deacetylase